MAAYQAETAIPNSTGTSRGLRCSVDLEILRAAIYRCNHAAFRLLLPHQCHAALTTAERIEKRLRDEDISSGSLDCGSEERAFVRYWGGPATDRLNGTQQLALTCYRDGCYAGARQVSEVMALDNGMAWSLIGHLRATHDPDLAHRQIKRTFERAMQMAESARDALNVQISAPQGVEGYERDNDLDDPGPTP